MVQSSERSLPETILRAHTLAGKAHKDGAKPLTRLGGAVAVGAIGVGGEFLVQKARPVALKKLDVENVELHPLLDELLNDGLVAVVYTVANKNLGEALPKLKLRHLTTSTLGTLAVKGTEGLRGRLRTRLASRRAGADGTQAAPALAEQPAPQLVATQAEGDKRKTLLDFVNPVTVLAADEARMAFVDWLEAYKAVSAGTEEEFVKTHMPKDAKEPTFTKETTTIIFAGNDAQLASALATVSGDRATS